MPLLLPAALLLFQAPALPRTVEVRPGVFVVQGPPDATVFSTLQAAGITHVLSLLKDGEGDVASDLRATQAAAADYGRCPLDREPKAVDLDAFRARMQALPRGARVLLYCGSGNRVAGALYAYWVLNEGLEPGKALDLAHRAGLANPVTEAAVKAYVLTRKQAPSPEKASP